MAKLQLKKEYWKSIRFYLIEVIAVVLFIQFIAGLAIVNGLSMEDTLCNGDIVVVWKIGYVPHPGDVVLVGKDNPLGVPLTKRIIAVEGQIIQIDEDGVYIDGQPLNEPYLKDTEWSRWPLELTVPDGQVFVMGDNRDESIDSRNVGCLEKSGIKGNIVFRLWTINTFGTIQT